MTRPKLYAMAQKDKIFLSAKPVLEALSANDGSVLELKIVLRDPVDGHARFDLGVLDNICWDAGINLVRS